MKNINKNELDRRIGYLNHMLVKLETHMVKEQSERVDIKHRLTHLHNLQ